MKTISKDVYTKPNKRMKTVFSLMVRSVICTFTIGGCMESDGNGEDAVSDNPSDIIDALDDNDVIDLLSDEDSESSSSGCNQKLPNITTVASEYCDTQFPDSCLFSGCNECQVCYVDLGCMMRDSIDAPNCICYGDGLCHKLCNDNDDCESDEECIDLGWADGTDIVPTACLKVCWKKDDPTSERCMMYTKNLTVC